MANKLAFGFVFRRFINISNVQYQNGAEGIPMEGGQRGGMFELL